MQYELKEGRYHLFKNGRLIDVNDEIAIVYDNTPGTHVLHKHGRSSLVADWYREAVTALRKGGCHAMADSLVLIQGKFPVDELNKLISSTGYINTFVKKYDLSLAGAV